MKNRQLWDRGFRRNSSLQAGWDTSIAGTTGFMWPHQECSSLFDVYNKAQLSRHFINSFFYITYVLVFFPTVPSQVKCPLVRYVSVGVVQHGWRRRCWGVGAATSRATGGSEEIGTGADSQCRQREAFDLVRSELVRAALVYTWYT